MLNFNFYIFRDEVAVETPETTEPIVTKTVEDVKAKTEEAEVCNAFFYFTLNDFVSVVFMINVGLSNFQSCCMIKTTAHFFLLLLVHIL